MKKRLSILVALALVLIGIGAWQIYPPLAPLAVGTLLMVEFWRLGPLGDERRKSR